MDMPFLAEDEGLMDHELLASGCGYEEHKQEGTTLEVFKRD
jgi:hypothetical protein